VLAPGYLLLRLRRSSQKTRGGKARLLIDSKHRLEKSSQGMHPERSLRQLTRAWHDVNGASNLRIIAVVNLKRRI